MSSTSRKRKYHPTPPAYAHRTTSASDPDPDPDINPALFVQAHEADVIRGPEARIAARALEVDGVGGRLVVGDGLIRWGGAEQSKPGRKEVGALVDFEGSSDDDDDGGRDDSDERAVWVDRYDARLLLDVLPSPSSSPTPAAPASPSGWSDLPSDAEDTFFFAPEEADEYRRAKRRRVFEQDREARLRALREADPEEEEEEAWGGSDEEPDTPQKQLMHHTATHILSSPNPAQLEMRILVNHGADRRFAFLRGRWRRAWEGVKGEVLASAERTKGGGGLGGLVGDYGDSDEDEDEEGDAEGSVVEPKAVAVEVEDTPDEAAVKEARRARARLWAEERRAMRVASGKS